MNIQDKPDYKVFASEARGGEVTDFPNLERGWGETIDKTEKIPPMEWFNLVGKRADEWLLYLTQRGVAEWDAKVKYPQYAMCQLGGRFYISTAENENKNPANSQTVWADLAKYLGVDGKLDANKIVQSTGQSTTNVMSQKAVTDAIPSVPKNTALKETNGWWKCADTGIIYQWGKWVNVYGGNDLVGKGQKGIPMGVNIDCRFNVNFTKCLNVQLNITNSDNRDSICSPVVTVHSWSNDKFVFQVSELWAVVQSSEIYWFAIGY